MTTRPQTYVVNLKRRADRRARMERVLPATWDVQFTSDWDGPMDGQDIDPDDLPSPRTAAVASFASFTVGALIPLSPFLVGYPVLSVALALAGGSAFVGGAAVANLTGRSPLLGGLRQFTAALLATGMAFLIGHLVSAHVG